MLSTCGKRYVTVCRFPTVGLPTQVPRVGPSPLSRKPAPPASLFATERGYYSITEQDVNGFAIVLSLYSLLTGEGEGNTMAVR